MHLPELLLVVRRGFRGSEKEREKSARSKKREKEEKIAILNSETYSIYLITYLLDKQKDKKDKKQKLKLKGL